MHSLRTRITLLTISIVLVAVAVIGLVSILSIQRTANQFSTQYMNEICLEVSGEFDHFLAEIRQDVDIAAHYLTDDISAVALVEGGVVGAVGTGDSIEGRDYESQQQQELDAYLHDHLDRARILMHSVAYNSTNALSYFYRINPEFTHTEPGFLFVRQGISDYQETAPTDVLSFSSDDLPRVGWYYETLDNGRPAWLSPYEDQNLGRVVTSYIAPIYKAGTFVSMVGMDISYDKLVEQVEELDIYRSGYAFLTDAFGRIVYHPTIASGTMLSEVNSELQDEEADLSVHEDSSTLINYTFNGVEKKAAWRSLSNGLRLFVSAPVSEIEETWQALILQILIIAAVLLVVFVTITTLIMRRITHPLRKLTAASEQIEQGNYDVDLPYEGRDEVGTLTRSFRHLTEHLKVYVSDLNSKAYKDALTNVKNKAAMDLYAAQLDDMEKGARQYAVLLFDCNDLKTINDAYGHDKGDIYLQTACEMICRSFSRSPVFRVGGDEFVVILEKTAYDQREDQILLFRENVKKSNLTAREPWTKISIALGMGEFDPSSDSDLSDVLKKADTEMYKDKRAYKASLEG